MIADPDTLTELEALVRQLDIRRAQVLIEAAIVEISGNVNDNLGLQWGYQGKNSVGQRGTGDSSIADPISVVGAPLDFTTMSVGQVLLRNSNFGVLVNALSQQRNVNLMSTPNLMTLDNEEAEFVVGQEISFTTGSYQQNNTPNSNPFNTTERKPVGLTLKVTPHIGDDNTLRLEIEKELSNVLESGTNINSNPVTSQRRIKTIIVVDNQETIVLGGILRDNVQKVTDKVPLLGDIPLLGRLFTNKRDVLEKQNLMLFIKPTIIRDREAAEAATLDKYSTLRMIHNGNSTSPLSGTMPEDAGGLFEGENHYTDKK